MVPPELWAPPGASAPFDPPVPPAPPPDLAPPTPGKDGLEGTDGSVTPGTFGAGAARGDCGTDGVVTGGVVTGGTVTVGMLNDGTVIGGGGSGGRSAAADAAQPAISPAIIRATWTDRRRSRNLTATTTREGPSEIGRLPLVPSFMKKAPCVKTDAAKRHNLRP
jgi:hypothetical protein